MKKKHSFSYFREILAARGFALQRGPFPADGQIFQRAPFPAHGQVLQQLQDVVLAARLRQLPSLPFLVVLQREAVGGLHVRVEVDPLGAPQRPGAASEKEKMFLWVQNERLRQAHPETLSFEFGSL